MPIDFRGQRQAVLNGGLEDATGGYDTSRRYGAVHVRVL